jgi:hypothetical protein
MYGIAMRNFFRSGAIYRVGRTAQQVVPTR